MNKPKNKFADKLVFVKEVLKHPLKMGAALPSSPQLAKAMAAQVHANTNDAILELGPGTGIVTRALIARGFAKQLNLVEFSENFVTYLKTNLSEIPVFHGSALELNTLLPKDKLFNTVVSSLPLRLFNQEQLAILWQQINDVMQKDGLFIQFSYLPFYQSFVIPNFSLKTVKTIWQNLPPARVYVYQKS